MVNALANVKNIVKPGIKPIKQIELATKWCPLVPEEFQDNVCPIPSQDVIDQFKTDKNKKKGQPKKTKYKKMKVDGLKNELRKLILPVTGRGKNTY